MKGPFKNPLPLHVQLTSAAFICHFLCICIVCTSNDLQGKLLSRRSRQDPVKMKMIETSETDIEEMAIPSPSSRCLPVMVQHGSRSAFEKRNSKEDPLPDHQDGSHDVWQLPGSSSSTPR